MASHRMSCSLSRPTIRLGKHASKNSTFQLRALSLETTPSTNPDVESPQPPITKPFKSPYIHPIKHIKPLHSTHATPLSSASRPSNPFATPSLVTLHSFPRYEPTKQVLYPPSYLSIPLRKDILHRAVIHEADCTRQGTASTRTRYEVRFSGRKIRPQKGSGKARLGDAGSPMLRSGGVAFGPKPRSFASGLQKKVYDLAWRMALSWLWKKGQLIVVDGKADVRRKVVGGLGTPGSVRYGLDILKWNNWGKENGGSLMVTQMKREGLWECLGRRMDSGKKLRKGEEIDERIKGHARCLTVDEVDLKDLLTWGRVIIEKQALDIIFRRRTSDLESKVKLAKTLSIQKTE